MQRKRGENMELIHRNMENAENLDLKNVKHGKKCGDLDLGISKCRDLDLEIFAVLVMDFEKFWKSANP